MSYLMADLTTPLGLRWFASQTVQNRRTIEEPLKIYFPLPKDLLKSDRIQLDMDTECTGTCQQ